MAVDATIHEYFEHNYALAAVATMFFLVIMQWLGWRWIKSQD